MIPLSSQLWMGYGVRTYVDLLNIYAGNAEVPAHFRRTRSSALDFTLTFKYEIRK
ncbi:hypothetical protein [Cesiribacter andamanensis]|uniref:Uncharacterized protein n=1 Tax=Cesiribacter andamanensis AMV16 TaxID=1279009 RepID=M7N5D6_9BACT|nr:hypothetical protein [Cesiribacter andamanensis]EMR02441.1 hypothetical protein ADICEAN_02427 [Cesiribacter andamanensis AMV16]